MNAATKTTSANIWTEWFPEETLRAVLAGEQVIADIGQVNGVWKKALKHEVKAGRLVTWRGKWFPMAGARFGMGPDKTCYGTAEARDFLTQLPA
jgi:hypothetical protein